MQQQNSQKMLGAFEALADWFHDGEFRREVSCFAADGLGIMAMATENRAGHVEFDFPTIWAACRAAPKWPRLVHMLHTHPPNCIDMSAEDANSTKGWVAALGVPVEMVVISTLGARCYRFEAGNKVTDWGFPIYESFSSDLVAAVMGGVSKSSRDYGEAGFAKIVSELNDQISTIHWDYFDRG